MNNKELVEYLNSLEITQKHLDWTEDIPKEIWAKHFFDGVFQTIKCGLEIIKHRWYETSIEVISINDGLIGVESVTDLFSEQSSVEDMFFTLNFFEMEEVPSVSYKIKKYDK